MSQKRRCRRLHKRQREFLCDIPVVARDDLHAAHRHKKHDHDKRDEDQTAVGKFERGEKVVHAVDKYRRPQRTAAADSRADRVAVVGVAPRRAVPHAHEHAEAGVARHRRNGARERRAEAVHGDIPDVFPQRKAERDEHRVYHAVKLAVEIRAAPRAGAEQQKLEPLLRERHDEEVPENQISEIDLVKQQIQDVLADRFRYDGERRGKHAENEQRNQNPRRFLFQPVGTVDLDHQNHRRDHRRGDQHGVHFAYGRQHGIPLRFSIYGFL